MNRRRDFHVKNDSVISGLRLESDIAKQLCDAARANAADAKGIGDVAQMARYLIRTGLGYTDVQSNAFEDAMLKPYRLRGLALEDEVARKLYEMARRLRVNWSTTVVGPTAAARHLIRVGLGVPIEESERREQRFAALAAAKREIMEVG